MKETKTSLMLVKKMFDCFEEKKTELIVFYILCKSV